MRFRIRGRRAVFVLVLLAIGWVTAFLFGSVPSLSFGFVYPAFATPLPSPCPRFVNTSIEKTGADCSGDEKSPDCVYRKRQSYLLQCDGRREGTISSDLRRSWEGEWFGKKPADGLKLIGKNEMTRFNNTYSMGNDEIERMVTLTSFSSADRTDGSPTFTARNEQESQTAFRFTPSNGYDEVSSETVESSREEIRHDNELFSREKIDVAKSRVECDRRVEGGCSQFVARGTDGSLYRETKILGKLATATTFSFLGKNYRSGIVTTSCRHRNGDTLCDISINLDGDQKTYELSENNFAKWTEQEKEGARAASAAAAIDCRSIVFLNPERRVRLRAAFDPTAVDTVCFADIPSSTTAESTAVSTIAPEPAMSPVLSTDPVTAPDSCPEDPEKTEPGLCGCGIADTDSDGDGTMDCFDFCPANPAKANVGVCGCGASETDSDADGTPDCIDQCPNDPGKSFPGNFGCGISDMDSDADGTPDCHDLCPIDQFKTSAEICGCGMSERDSNGNGIPDCIEPPIDTAMIPWWNDMIVPADD